MTPATEVPRLTPLSAPYSPDVAAQLQKWMPPGATLEPLALFRTLSLHLELASRMRPLGAGILGARATVPMHLREVMIQRTCALTGAEYEWGVHAAAFADAAGLDEERLRSTVHGGPLEECWTPLEASVVALADELHETSSISDQLWARLTGELGPEQIIELVVTAGWYHVIAYVCNGLRVEHEQWAPRFPPGPGAE
jgi:4-carboxymuconolactone decarboxylase